MFRITDIWGIFAVGMTLVLVYLFLTNSKGARDLITSGSSATNSLFKTLQGR